MLSFVTERMVTPAPPEYRGTALAWRLKDPHAVSHEQFAELIRHGDRLSRDERISLLSRLSRTGQVPEAEELKKHHQAFTGAETLIHALYGKALIEILRSAQRSEPRAGGGETRPAPREQVEIADSLLASNATYARSRSQTSDIGGWMSIERNVEGLIDAGMLAMVELSRAWLDFERAIVEPLAAVGRGRAPNHFGVRMRILARISTPSSAPDLLALIDDWPAARAWILRSGYVADSGTPGILQDLLVAIWRSKVAAHREAVARWLETMRSRDDLLPAERAIVRSFCQFAVGPSALPLPESARAELSAWIR